MNTRTPDIENIGKRYRWSDRRLSELSRRTGWVVATSRKTVTCLSASSAFEDQRSQSLVFSIRNDASGLVPRIQELLT